MGSYARRYPGSLADEEARLQELRSTRSLAEPYLRIRRDERRCVESLLAEVQGLIDGSQNEAPASQPASSSHFVDRHEEKRERQSRKDSEEENAVLDDTPGRMQDAAGEQQQWLRGIVIVVLLGWLFFRICVRRWYKSPEHIQ